MQFQQRKEFLCVFGSLFLSHLTQFAKLFVLIGKVASHLCVPDEDGFLDESLRAALDHLHRLGASSLQRHVQHRIHLGRVAVRNGQNQPVRDRLRRLVRLCTFQLLTDGGARVPPQILHTGTHVASNCFTRNREFLRRCPRFVSKQGKGKIVQMVAVVTTSKAASFT